jgi:hypothetical protein
LGPLLQAIPGLVTAGEVQSGRYMEVVVDGALALDKSGEFFHPFVRGANGRISETAKLVNPERLQELVNVAAVYNVVNFIAAQKHLADISTKLDQLQKGVDAIARHLKDQQKAVVSTAVQMYREYAASILQGNRELAVRLQLESKEAELSEIGTMLLKDIDYAAAEASKAEPAAFWNVVAKWGGDADFVVKARNDRHIIQSLAATWRECTLVRIAGVQLMAAFPEARDLARIRLQRILSDVAEFGRRVDRAAGTLQKHAERSLDAGHGDRADLVQRSSATSLLGDSSAIKRATESVEGLLLSQSERVTLAVRLDNEGRSVEAFRIPSAT